MIHERWRDANRAIREFFDQRAAQWDDCVCAEHGERLAGIVAALSIARGARVLDVGTGTGVLLPILAEAVGRDGGLVALDISFKMLVEVHARDYPGRIACLQGDTLALPVADGVFDWIVCNSCFPHFHDQERALGELSRTLSPEGRLVICHTQSRDAINAMHREVGDVVGGHELPDAATLHTFLAGAGLRAESYDDREERYLVVARRAVPH